MLRERQHKISVDFRVPFSIGMLITLAGAFWDAYRHLNGLATSESLLNPFLNPAHGTIYGGATIMAISVILYRYGWLKSSISISKKSDLIMRIGVLTLLGGGIFDLWWHTTYGFTDTTPWTPSHMTATAGFVVLLVTSIVSLSKNSSRLVKGAFALSLALFVGLWTMVVMLA